MNESLVFGTHEPNFHVNGSLEKHFSSLWEPNLVTNGELQIADQDSNGTYINNYTQSQTFRAAILSACNFSSSGS